MTADFKKLREQFVAYQTGFWLSDLANFSALVFHEMPDLNWAGFYLDDGEKLVLGPFCGKAACTQIAYTRGVCGDAYRQAQSIRVPNVHQYPGHLSCDSASQSELVTPLFYQSKLIGVFDLDSPLLNRFSEEDEHEIQKLLADLMEGLDDRFVKASCFGAI
jgi:L-methionine (R)-S-oxide reductase